ncbi:MAG: hypothetical protein AAGJ40_21430 [Planctomycetota bacterium]
MSGPIWLKPAEAFGSTVASTTTRLVVDCVGVWGCIAPVWFELSSTE